MPRRCEARCGRFIGNRKGRRFCSKKCANKVRWQERKREPNRICVCGCGKTLPPHKSKYYQSSHDPKNSPEIGIHVKRTRRRPKHIKTYCIQATGQCQKYDEGFSIENIDGGCWGNNYTGDCYERPKQNRVFKNSQLANIY